MVARPRPTRSTAQASHESEAPGRVADLAIRLLVFLVILGVIALPLLCETSAQNRFRLIKELLLRTEAIVGLFLVTIAAAFGDGERLRRMQRHRAVVVVIAGTLVWTTITMLLSTNRVLSIASSTSVVCAAMLFFVVWYTAPSVPLLVLDALAIVTVINACVAALQEYGIWQPFVSTIETRGHLETTAFIDNPNVVGSYLAIAAIALITAALKSAGMRRVLYWLSGIVAIAGVMVADTRTAMITLLAVAVLSAAMRSMKLAILGFVFLASVLFAAAMLGFSPAKRIVSVPFAALTNLNQATSGRMVPFRAAWLMFREHPLTGAGPGTFKYHFMTHQVNISQQYPPDERSLFGTNFGEAHNDHLQVLAETGLPGYLLLATALIILAKRPREPATDTRGRLARSLALPLAAAFAVLALAQFPLQVAVMRHLFLTLAALVIGWRES